MPAGARRVDLRPGKSPDFRFSWEPAANDAITLRVSVEGSGRHAFAIRAFNLEVRQPEKAITLETGKPAAIVWEAAVRTPGVPWIAVAVPDGDLGGREELTAPAAR